MARFASAELAAEGATGSTSGAAMSGSGVGFGHEKLGELRPGGTSSHGCHALARWNRGEMLGVKCWLKWLDAAVT